MDKIPKHELTEIIQYSALAEDQRELVRTPAQQKQLAGYAISGVRRPVLLRALIEEAQARGVPVVFGHQLVSFEQHEDSVTVRFANGKTDTGSFVVGCDGLHSDTRKTLFGEEAVSFTGLIQVSKSGDVESKRSLLTDWATRREASRPTLNCLEQGIRGRCLTSTATASI